MNYFDLNIYSIQQNINWFLIKQVNHLSLTNLLITFTGGIFTSISPCVLSSIPVATLYINTTKHKIYNTLILIAGISSAILSIGTITILLKRYSWQIFGAVPFLWPMTIIIIGLSLLEIISINNIDLTKHKQFGYQDSFLQTYIIGIGLGLSISPCSTPITMTLIAWINTTEKYVQGFILLLLYVVGYITPIIISIISLKNLEKLIYLSKKSYIIINILGCITVTSGSYYLFKEILIFT
uniref:Thiol:disulfi de interchange protein n=1 Tax=Hommersandiophycus borowitzkae TaxID=268573 RepID=A0A1G4NTQ3_9FLOR|nr:Thiol:disulfi de interchange protein [Hommersandiophycus borowitzkae]SCW22071.1 Thiol:disulfi de interchange protein [Hommersandiophycus borowitzkae]